MFVFVYCVCMEINVVDWILRANSSRIEKSKFTCDDQNPLVSEKLSLLLFFIDKITVQTLKFGYERLDTYKIVFVFSSFL